MALDLRRQIHQPHFLQAISRENTSTLLSGSGSDRLEEWKHLFEIRDVKRKREGGGFAETCFLLREMFEVGQCNKILSPSKMRDTYRKCMYFLEDDQTATASTGLGISLHKYIVPFPEKEGEQDFSQARGLFLLCNV